MLISTLVVVSYLYCAVNSFLTETNSEFKLTNDDITVRILKVNGNIVSMATNDNKIKLTKEMSCDFVFQEKLIHGTMDVTEITAEDYSPDSSLLEIIKSNQQIVMKYLYKIYEDEIVWSAEIGTRDNLLREIAIKFDLPILSFFSNLHYPGIQRPLKIAEGNNIKILYRRDFALPILTLNSDTLAAGLSVIASLDVYKPNFSLSVMKGLLRLQFENLQCSSLHPVKAEIRFVTHAGDWRNGLHHLVNKYPEFFIPVDTSILQSEGYFYLTGPDIPLENIARIADKQVSWVELHMYFPFYGLYIPNISTWSRIIDSDQIPLGVWEKGPNSNSLSIENLRKGINLWQQKNIHVYAYIQPFEAWHQYAEKYFPANIAKDINNKALPSWKYTNLLNPDPNSAWGQHIMSDVQRLFSYVPEIDGIFYDRMDYWDHDFAHDDGYTMIDNKRAYTLAFALSSINKKIFDFTHDRNKPIWGNGPSSIEVCRDLDGIMAEGSLWNLQRLQYLCIARPYVYLPYDRTPAETEEKLKNALVCGAFPSITYGGKDCEKLDEKYAPLFKLLKGRIWVLTNNPLKIPDRFISNIFQLPDSEYAVIIISPKKSQLKSRFFEYNVPIEINLIDFQYIKHAYLLSGDWSGIIELPFSINNERLQFKIPYHLSSSLVLLTKKPKFRFLRTSSPILNKKTENIITFKMPPIGYQGKSDIKLNTPWRQYESRIINNTVRFTVTLPEDVEHEVPMSLVYNDSVYSFSNRIVEPLSIVSLEDIFIHEERGQNVTLYITNNLDTKISLNLLISYIEGMGKAKVPENCVLKAKETQTLEIWIAPTTQKSTLKLSCIGDIHFEWTKEVETISPLCSNDLFHDEFISGMRNWIHEKNNWTLLDRHVRGRGSAHFAYVLNKTWQDYTYEVTTRCLGSTDPNINWLKSYIFFRIQDDKNFYRFGIHGGYEMLSLYKRENGKWSELAKVPFSAEKDRWYTLKVDVVENKIICYLDGRSMISVTDRTFSAGGVGIGVLEDNMQTEYKNAVVKKLSL